MSERRPGGTARGREPDSSRILVWNGLVTRVRRVGAKRAPRPPMSAGMPGLPVPTAGSDTPDRVSDTRESV